MTDQERHLQASLSAQRFSEEVARVRAWRKLFAAWDRGDEPRYGDWEAFTITDSGCFEKFVIPQSEHFARRAMAHETGHLGEVIEREDLAEQQRQAQQRATFGQPSG